MWNELVILTSSTHTGQRMNNRDNNISNFKKNYFLPLMHFCNRQRLVNLLLFFFWKAKDPQLLCHCQSEQSCVWPLRHLKLFGESLQMRIRARAWKKDSGTGDSSFFFFFFRQKGRWKSKANNSENFTKQMQQGKDKGELRALNTRGPLFLHSRCCLYCWQAF